jgi:hypothetical protein
MVPGKGWRPIREQGDEIALVDRLLDNIERHEGDAEAVGRRLDHSSARQPMRLQSQQPAPLGAAG